MATHGRAPVASPSPSHAHAQPVAAAPAAAALLTPHYPQSHPMHASPSSHSLSASPGLSSPSPAVGGAGGAVGPSSVHSPASGVPQWQSRPVSESVFDALHWEMVRYFAAQLQAQIKTDSRVLSRKLHSKLEGMGFGVGQRFAERFSRDHPYLDSSLDVVKLLCKELWMLLYKKQIDKLQTNYKGIYVLHDLQFRCVSRVFALSSDVDGASLLDAARVYTSLSCGIIRGALWNLGLHASVKADIHKLPAVQFTIMEEKAAANAAPAANAARAHGGTSAAATAVAAAAAAHSQAAHPNQQSASQQRPTNGGLASGGHPPTATSGANRPRTSLGGTVPAPAPAPRSHTGTPTRG